MYNSVPPQCEHAFGRDGLAGSLMIDPPKSSGTSRKRKRRFTRQAGRRLLIQDDVGHGAVSKEDQQGCPKDFAIEGIHIDFRPRIHA